MTYYVPSWAAPFPIFICCRNLEQTRVDSSTVLYIQHWWNYKKSTITKLQIAYHNILKMFLGMSKYESTSYLCTRFDIQCCQSVIRKLVYGFMCRLDSYVNYIIHGIGAIQVLRNADGGGGCLIFWKKR